MIEPIKIDHVCLLVSDLNRARGYYERFFNAKCWLREDDPNTLICEAKNVHFFLSESESDTELLSSQHLSLQVSDLADVISKLKVLGVTDYKTGVVDFFERDNYRWCEWRDPDGIRLECVEVIKPKST